MSIARWIITLSWLAFVVDTAAMGFEIAGVKVVAGADGGVTGLLSRLAIDLM